MDEQGDRGGEERKEPGCVCVWGNYWVPDGWLKDYGENLDMLVLTSDLTFLANEMFYDKPCCSDYFCSLFFLI